MINKSLRVILILLSISFFSLNVTAQLKSAITGTVFDSTSQKPLQYVTVELFKNNDSVQVIKSTYTNEKGRYDFTGMDTAMYTVIFSHTGFATNRQLLKISSADTKVEMKVVQLTLSKGTLQGVVVTARKPLVEITDDKIIFNAENDPASKTQNAIDILRKTPFVSVDGDDNVSVNGQTNFKVLLNGRETSMFSQNVKEALKGFPGAAIVKIEVITSPSAKYDGEGVGGIINIITKKKIVGYNGSVNTFYSNTGWYNINTNFSAKFGKLGITAYYGAGGSNNIKGRSKVETVPLIPAYFSHRTLSGSRISSNFWNYGNVEISYDIDTLNTLAFYGNISGGHNRNKLAQTIVTSYNNNPDSTDYYDLDSKYIYPNKSAGADFIKKFSKNSDKEFSLRFNGEFGTNNTFLNSIMDNQVAADRYVINNSIAKNRQYTIQSDYVLPLTPNKKLESGIKIILRKASSDFDGKIKENSFDEYKENPLNTDKFTYRQNVYSAYSSYNVKIGKTGLRIGARIEHTEINGDFTSSAAKIKQDYTNLLPNLQASFKLSDVFSIVLTYSERIQRPAIGNLNPFRNDNDPKNVSYGNPRLQPQTIHSFAIQTRFKKGVTFAGITFTGSYSNNIIVPYATFDPVTGVTSTTSGNFGKEKVLMTNGNFNTKINKSWSVVLNGYLRYNKVENKFLAGQNNSGFSGNANLNTSYSLSKYFTASGYAGFYQNPVTIQSKYSLNIWYGLNVGYKLFHEKLTASVGLTNFFEKNRNYKNTTTDADFIYTSVSTLPFRAFSIGLTWNFGKLTESVSKKKGVANDDQLAAPSN